MTDDLIIIVRHEAGPAHGFVTVTVADGPVDTATLVIPEQIVGTPQELQAIRQMLNERAARKDAIRGEN